MTLFQDNLSPYLTAVEQGSTPANPASGNQKLFVRTSDHVLCYLNSSGTVTPLTPGFANPMTTKGDVILGDTGGAATRLAAGTSAYVLTSNGAAAFPSWQAAAGGGGVSGKLPIQDKATGAGSSTNALAFTLGSAPTNGNLLIACIGRDSTGAISNITQTGVTWTQAATSGNGSAPVVEIWKGVVGGSASASGTINCATVTYTGAHISEWNGITGTLDQSAILSAQTTGDGAFVPTPIILPTQANALVIAACSTSSNSNLFRAMIGMQTFKAIIVTGATVCAGFAFPGTTPISGVGKPGAGNSTTYSGAIVSLT